VPRALQPELGGKSHIEGTLKTRDLSLAQRRRWQHVQAAHALFDGLRGGNSELTPVEIEMRAWAVYDDTLEYAEKHGFTEENIEANLHQIPQDIEDGNLTENRDWTEVEQAEAWARYAALRGRLAALQGKPFEPPAVFGPRGVDRITLKPVMQKQSSAKTKSGLQFSKVAQRYLDETQRDATARLTEQTVSQYRAVYRLFKEYCRDVALEDVTRATAGDFISAVESLDPNWGRSPKTKSRSLAEIVERYGGHPTGLSNRTLNRYMNCLGMVFKWARKRGLYDGGNPFEGQSRKVASSRKTGWKPFTVEELSILLNGMQPQIAPNKHTIDSALSWATWISAYGGMRLNEICSLNVTDIKEEDGVWFFDVTEAKSEAGDRLIPLHSTLLRIGLLDYRERVGKGQLWPALKPGGPDGKLSWYASKRFTTLRRALGLTSPRLSFHSLRKNVGTALERAGVPENEAVQILGHEKLSMSYSIYSIGLDLRGLRDVIEKIEYP